MGVHLRERKVKDGKISFYLDIYYKGARRCQSLGITISQDESTESALLKRLFAESIRKKLAKQLGLKLNGISERFSRRPKTNTNNKI